MRLFAFYSRSPAAVGQVRRRLHAAGAFEWVGSPGLGEWVVAHNGPALPREHAVFVVEGSPATALSCAADWRHASPGADELDSQSGDFTFACFGEFGRVRVVRAAAGVAPIYLWQAWGEAAFATRLGDIARFLPQAPKLDRLALAISSSWFPWFVDGRTFLENTRALEAGHAADWEPGRRWRPRAWWLGLRAPMPARPSLERVREHSDRLRTALISSVDAGVSADGATLVTFSGGVDSSALVALAAGVHGRTMSTLTFVPSCEPARSQVRHYSNALLGRFQGSIRRRWEFSDSPRNRLAWLDEVPPEVFLVPHPALCVLPRVTREQEIRVVCGGEFCDDLFGSALTMYDWALGTRASSLLFHPRELPGGRWRGTSTWLKLRARHSLRIPRLPFAPELPDLVHPALSAEYAELYRDEQRSVGLSDSGRGYLLQRLRAAQPAIAMNSEVLSGLGIRRSFPFYRRDLVELAFECHPSEGLGPGTKKLLRTALDGIVPKENLYRKNKESGRLQDHPLPWGRELPAELSGVLRDDLLERRPESLPSSDALRLACLMNIVRGLRNMR